MADLVILGGGASGLMAAVSAARFIPGKNISILERGPRVGKKLLVTGNGRCNLTNLELDFSRYHGAPESFVSAVFSQLPPKDTLSLFGRLGLLCREEGQGRCYPYGGQASAVLDLSLIHILMLSPTQSLFSQSISLNRLLPQTSSSYFPVIATGNDSLER